MKFNQAEHKKNYGLPAALKLKGFVVVNEEKEDLLAVFNQKAAAVLTAYTQSPSQAIIFKTVEHAQAVIETIGKPLLVSAIYENKKQFAVARVLKYFPESANT